MQENEAEVYNKIAKEYYNLKKELYPKNDLEKFLSYLPQGSLILDLGCGPGQASKIFSNRKYLVTGIDFSEEMIKLAKKDVPNAKFIQEDMRNINEVFRENMFDGVWACASILHIPKQEVSPVFRQLHNILKENGIFYLSVKEGNGEEDRIDERYENITRHFTYFKRDEIIRLLKSNNLKPIYFSSNPRNYAKDKEKRWINFIAKKL